MNDLITGATGFIGQRLTEALYARAETIFAATRDLDAVTSHWQDQSVIPKYVDLNKPDTLKGLCTGIEIVFHLAGYVHADNAYGDDNEEKYWQTTVDGTRFLLTEALRAGVKKFIFASSVKAMGEGSPICLDEAHSEEPVSAYGRAKLAAEKLILEIGRTHGLHVCNVRLPLVYGSGNKGNIPRMIRAIDRGIFPPLPDIHNKRSMVHVDDAVQAILLAADKDESRDQTYVVTDGHIYSSREIYTMICEALGKTTSRWTVPLTVLRTIARMGDIIGRLRGRPFVFDSEALGKLVGSAWYSSDKIQRELGYRPTRTLRHALPEMICDYRKIQTKSDEKCSIRAADERP
jgi:UDP-glucose 4-epimerase